jgi:hypothetical protein
MVGSSPFIEGWGWGSKNSSPYGSSSLGTRLYNFSLPRHKCSDTGSKILSGIVLELLPYTCVSTWYRSRWTGDFQSPKAICPSDWQQPHQAKARTENIWLLKYSGGWYGSIMRASAKVHRQFVPLLSDSLHFHESFPQLYPRLPPHCFFSGPVPTQTQHLPPFGLPCQRLLLA